MAFTSWITNQIPASGGEALYNLKEMLKGAGWTVNGYSDGTTFLNGSAGVDGITTGGSGAGGFDNSAAWIRLTAPSGVELVFQRGASDEKNVYIKYSPSSGFITGGGASNTPTATDQVDIHGSDSTGAQLFSAGNAYYMQGGADNANEYGFWMACYLFTQEVSTGFVMEPLTQTDSNDTTAGHQNLLYTSYGSTSFSSSNISGAAANMRSYLGGTWIQVLANIYYDNGAAVFPTNAGVNSFSSNDDRVPIIYSRPTVDFSSNPFTLPHGYKGVSRFMTWEGTARSCADTKSSRTRIVFGEVSLPWDGTTTPLV